MPPVIVFGWELHHTGPSSTQRGSDKYYRVLVVDTTVLINYGRRGATGNFVTHRFTTATDAKAKARALTNEKSGKGYRVTRDMTDFEVTAARVHFLTKAPIGSGRPPLADSTWLVNQFKAAADNLGTVESGASR